MGGFAGGDEGGYWDTDTPLASTDHRANTASNTTSQKKSHIETTATGYSIKAYTIVKTTEYENYVYTEDLFDTISFIPCQCDVFTIEGCGDIPLESNSIYKSFRTLNDFVDDSDILDFFYTHKVVVTKRIPVSAGLGGASSDAAAFLHLTKEACNLILTKDELERIASAIGPKVPFFI